MVLSCQVRKRRPWLLKKFFPPDLSLPTQEAFRLAAPAELVQRQIHLLPPSPRYWSPATSHARRPSRASGTSCQACPGHPCRVSSMADFSNEGEECLATASLI